MSRDHHLYPDEWEKENPMHTDPPPQPDNALDDARSQALHLISLPSFQAMCDREEEVVV